MNIVQWLQENVFGLVGGISIIAFISVLYRTFIVSVIPKILLWVKRVVIKVVANAFGMEIDEANLDNINQLPFVEKFNRLAEDIQLQNELKLVELKQKLASPVYTAIEKVPIEKLYLALYNKIKDKLSQEVIDVLETLEEMSM